MAYTMSYSSACTNLRGELHANVVHTSSMVKAGVGEKKPPPLIDEGTS